MVREQRTSGPIEREKACEGGLGMCERARAREGCEGGKRDREIV